MSHNKNNWKDLPVLHILHSEGERDLKIIGTLEGLGSLLYAIAMAMGTGQCEAEVLCSDADPYMVRVFLKNHAYEWDEVPMPEEEKD
jgi:hypothetical protein